MWISVLPISYAVFSALFGTQSLTFSKTLSVLLRATFSGNNQLTQWFTWVVIPLFLCCSVFWVTRLNKVGAAPERPGGPPARSFGRGRSCRAPGARLASNSACISNTTPAPPPPPPPPTLPSAAGAAPVPGHGHRAHHADRLDAVRHHQRHALL
jgi:hypothetical protein